LGAPLPALRGVPGTLARANAMRNPRRTSATAAALMVGVAVVTLFTVLAASIRASTDASVRQSFGGDLAITSANFVGDLSPRLADDVGRLPEVAAAAGLATTAVLVDGTGTAVSVSDPGRLAAVLDLDVRDGSVAGLGDRRLAVADQTATDHGWRLGSEVRIGYPDGTTDRLTVGAVYRARTVVGNYLLPRAAWAPHATQDIDSMVLIGLRDGVDLAAGRTAVERVAAAYGNPSVRDRSELADTLSSGVDTALGIIYALLALAVLIALMGIANTLALSIHERTRELGVLRAIGLTRRQLRGMVRWESVLIAVFGTIGGLGLGVFLGWAMVRAAGADIGTFAAAPIRLVVVLAIGAAVGVLAAVRPTRRAARLDVLAAIATE
jgi:putative ABC transport system permease protein